MFYVRLEFNVFQCLKALVFWVIVLFKMFSRWFFASEKLIITLTTSNVIT